MKYVWVFHNNETCDIEVFKTKRLAYKYLKSHTSKQERSCKVATIWKNSIKEKEII